MTDVVVTQADRDAASRFVEGYCRIDRYTYSARRMVVIGDWDDHPMVQDFARHRIASEAAAVERAAAYHDKRAAFHAECQAAMELAGSDAAALNHAALRGRHETDAAAIRSSIAPNAEQEKGA